MVVGGGSPLETTGDHRGQFPQSDFGQAAAIYSSNNAAMTPKVTLVWRIFGKSNLETLSTI